jgi:hypothetical protein
MIKKNTIAFFIFLVAILYIISPWFFEKNFFVNELLSLTGLCILIYKRFRIGADKISVLIVVLLLLCLLHAGFSILKADNLYYYLRNLVIFYSILSYFVGFYLQSYFSSFFNSIRKVFLVYTGGAMLWAPSRIFFERFGVSSLFPYAFKNVNKYSLFILVLINVVYGFTLDSATAIFVSFFYLFLLVCPGLKFFRQTIILGFVVFALFFIVIQPDLNKITDGFSLYNSIAIHNVMRSNYLLNLDGNTTWRLVLWKQVIVDQFPLNLAGIGFGTPMFRYFPVEDYTKLASLPYVLGAHNSFVYLFGRLGIVFVLLILSVYGIIFKEYFLFKKFYYQTNGIAFFWSFFAISIIALLNPVLESPIFASGYWLILGLLSRVIANRYRTEKTN